MGSGPGNHIIVFSADGFPIQYAFVPSARVIYSGLKPFSFAKAEYASSRVGEIALMCQHQLIGMFEESGLTSSMTYCWCLTDVCFKNVLNIASLTWFEYLAEPELPLKAPVMEA